MHIPDGFLSAPVACVSGVAAVVGVGFCCRHLRATGNSRQRALLGVSAAFVFAAQMVNFPVAAGTSGHLVGGTLLAALLGLPAAVVVMTSVLLVQCFAFGDGGVLALGANISNMALVSCAVGHCLYRLGCGPDPSHRRRIASVAFAAWCATLAAAACCAEQIALSRAAPLASLVPAMLGVHALIGVGEAVITALIVASVQRVRPELLASRARGAGLRAGPTPWGFALGLSLLVGLLLAPIASSAPDGLARVSARLGIHGAPHSFLAAPFSDYGLPGLGASRLTTMVAGGLGTLSMFGLSWLLAIALVPKVRSAKSARAGVTVESAG